jgi:hypothetical protein
MPIQINIICAGTQEEESNTTNGLQSQRQLEEDDEESGKVLRRERRASEKKLLSDEYLLATNQRRGTVAGRRTQERESLMLERKRKRDEAKEDRLRAKERKRQERLERQRAAQERRALEVLQRQRAAEAARLQRERELAERRALVQARLRPALHCNMDSIVLFNDVHRYYDVGACNLPCMYCGALGFQDENRGTNTRRHYGILCCNQGKIMFDPLPELPPTLLHLFNSEDNDAKHFRKNIRQFNAGEMD